jgi:hypothetical protein
MRNTSKRGRTLARTVMGLLLAGALVGIASPASAAAPDPSVTIGTATAQPAVRAVKPATAAAANFTYKCFTSTGNFKSGSTILWVDWTNNGSWDECFGIVPNRTIYHEWPNSGGWKVMPNGGLADDTDIAFRNSAGQHVVAVWVNNVGDYCSTLTTGWQRWVRCL